MLWKNLIEIIFSFGLFINAMLFIPQALKISRTKNAKGFSLITFSGFNIIQTFAFLHGCLHKDYILAFGMLMSLITCGTVTILIIKYR